MIGRKFTLWRLRRERRRSARQFTKLIRSAKNEEEAQSLTGEAMDVREDIRDAILHLNSLELLDEAEHLGLAIPSYSENRESWEEGREDGKIHLTREAQLQLTQSVRNEQRERWSVFAFVLKEIVTPLVGVLGAVMGLLSLIHAFHSK
jgi:hypothetical protein